MVSRKTRHVLCSILILDLANGICFYNSLKREKNAYGPGRRYCEYFPDGDKNSKPLEIMIGSQFETRDCMRCSCTDQGFRCCGVGIRERSFYVPRDCKLVANGCRPMIVLKTNIYADCYSGRPVNGYNTVGYTQSSPLDMVRQIKQFQRKFNTKKGESESVLKHPYMRGNPVFALMQSLEVKK